MPIYMDRHYLEGATRQVLATAHEKDLANREQVWGAVHYLLV